MFLVSRWLRDKTLVKMVISREKFEVKFRSVEASLSADIGICLLQELLERTVNSKQVHQFKYIIDDLKVNPDTPQTCFRNLSLFEKVLSVPGNKNFINICVQFGSDFYQVSKWMIIEMTKKFDWFFTFAEKQ